MSGETWTMPVLRPRFDGKWELVEDYLFVRAGFVTDGASIPRWLWRVCGHPMEAPMVAAALLHDARYAEGKESRLDCDVWFRNGLEVLGVGFVRRWAFYFAVRLFGGRHYKKQETKK